MPTLAAAVDTGGARPYIGGCVNLRFWKRLARKEKIILSLQEVSKAAQAVLEVSRVDKLFQVSGNNYIPPLK